MGQLARLAAAEVSFDTSCLDDYLAGMAPPLSDPAYWRDRAKELRALADRLTEADAREMILKCAHDYDRLAERAESRLGST